MRIQQLAHPNWQREPHNWQDGAFQATANYKQGNGYHEVTVAWYDVGLYEVSRRYYDDVTGEDLTEPQSGQYPEKMALEIVNRLTKFWR